MAFLEVKMLLLCFFLLSCCLSVSMGSAIEEFDTNFKVLVKLANNEIFLHVPAGRFKCNCVHYHLNTTMEQLKSAKDFKNNETTAYVSLMEKNMAHIIRNLNKRYIEPKENGSCQMKEVLLPTALKRYEKFFQRLNEENHCA